MTKKHIILIAIILWVAFIFFNSLQIGTISGAMSGNITQWLASVISKIGIEVDAIVLSTWVRKGAHAREFFILGLLLLLYQYQLAITFKWRLIHVAIFGLLVAVLDETIQTFVPGRSGSLVDVLIDLIGITFACSVGLFSAMRNKRQ